MRRDVDYGTNEVGRQSNSSIHI